MPLAVCVVEIIVDAVNQNGNLIGTIAIFRAELGMHQRRTCQNHRDDRSHNVPANHIASCKKREARYSGPIRVFRCTSFASSSKRLQIEDSIHPNPAGPVNLPISSAVPRTRGARGNRFRCHPWVVAPSYAAANPSIMGGACRYDFPLAEGLWPSIFPKASN